MKLNDFINDLIKMRDGYLDGGENCNNYIVAVKTTGGIPSSKVEITDFYVGMDFDSGHVLLIPKKDLPNP